jgi:hypothetical protein
MHVPFKTSTQHGSVSHYGSVWGAEPGMPNLTKQNKATLLPAMQAVTMQNGLISTACQTRECPL